MRWMIAALTAAAALAAGVATYVFLAGGDDRFAKCREGAVAGGAGAIGGPFTLVSETGETVTDAEVLTAPALVYFGYTFCPDVCPFDAVRNADATDLLEKRGIEIIPVFVTVDPERDTAERMAEFTDYIHPRMIGLTGSEEQVRAAAQAYRAYYRKQDSADEFYLVDHSTFTYLVLPGHGFVEFFRRDTTAEEIAERTSCFVNAA